MPTPPGTRARAGLPTRLLLACLLAASAPAAVRAQDDAASRPPVSADDSAPAAHHFPRRLYVGMWTTHLNRRPVTLDNNWVIGATAGGYFGATFLNSFGRRAFTAGLQRTIVSTGRPPLAASIGYRLGFITGYDGRFTALARKTPVLPLAQPFVSVGLGRTAVELSYTVVVVSVAVSYDISRPDPRRRP